MQGKVKREHELHQKLLKLIDFCIDNEIEISHNGTELLITSLKDYNDLGDCNIFALRFEDDSSKYDMYLPGCPINGGFDDEIRLYTTQKRQLR